MKKLIRKVAASMIAFVAILAVVGTAMPVEAAARAPKKIYLKTTTKTVDIKGKATVSVKSVKPASASKSVSFKSSNKKIATVSSKGVVTGKKAGKVKITVTSKKNKKVKKTVTIRVKNLKPSSIAVNNISLNVGKQQALNAVVKPAGVYCPLIYSSNNTAVATVSSKGVVKANAGGKAVITVKATQKNSKKQYIYKTCTVTVIDPTVATEAQVKAYMNDDNENTVLVDARVADAYQGWALDEAKKGGHLKNAVNVSAQWLDCYYWSHKKENKTREESIQKELDANAMTASKSYIIYDTNGKDAIKVKNFLNNKGYKNIKTFNATNMINASEDLVSYTNYDLYVPAAVVKNISDHVVDGAELSSQASALVKNAPIVLLDVSWGNEEESGYLEGHVPGTIHVNTDEYETPQVYVEEKSEGYREEWRLNSDEKLFELAENKGITKDSCVIITGGEPMATTRMGMILKYLGCDNVHVMSEGMTGWEAKMFPKETKSNAAAKVEFGVKTPQNPDLIDTIEEVKAKIGTEDFQLIDTRTIEEWDGASSGYGYHDLAGRIEGSIFSPCGIGYSSSVYYYRNPDKSMRSKEALEALWAKDGVDPTKHMSFFCGSGWRAAETAWDAMVLGYEKVSLYSDGWIGWSNEGNPYIDSEGDLVKYDKTTNSVISADPTVASIELVQAYMNDSDDNTVLVDARVADAYQGWALDEANKGGHLKNAVNISAQWLDCNYSSNKKENKTREESIQKELDVNNMTADKSYIIYDTNKKDAVKVKTYLADKGYKNILTYNAKKLINADDTELVSYPNYDLYVPAAVVKNISDHVVDGAELSSQASALVKNAPIVLLDVSWGNEKQSGYLKGHVPGTIHVNTDEYETPQVYVEEKSEGYREEWRLNSDEKLFELAENKGITKDSCVIITGGEPMATTRMGMILKYLGCDNVHVMSEGMTGWNAKAYEMETKSNSASKVSFGVTTPQNPDLIDTIEEVKEKIGTEDFQLIDTRTIEEWNGASSGYGYHDLAGRIEGSIFSPCGIGYSSSVYYYRNPDKSMRSKEALEALWAKDGVDPTKHMSFFCGSGWRAAETAWDAMVLGYEKVSLYSDGWIGWSNEGNPYLNSENQKVRYDKTTNSVIPVE